MQGLVQEGEEEEKYDIVASSPEVNVSAQKRRGEGEQSSSKKQNPDNSLGGAAQGPAQFMQNEKSEKPNLALSPQKKNPLVGNNGA